MCRFYEHFCTLTLLLLHNSLKFCLAEVTLRFRANLTRSLYAK
jgi:hypothetical protein